MKYRAAFLLLVLPLAVQADDKYVNVPTAQIKTKNSAWSDTVIEVKRGEKLSVLDGGDARWFKVALASKANTTGWIYFNKVVNEKPEEVDVDFFFGGGISSEDLQTGGAIRGLTESSKKYKDKKKIPNWAVRNLYLIRTFPKTIEDFDKNANGELSRKEFNKAGKNYRKWIDNNLDNFLKEGHIGEYAK